MTIIVLVTWGKHDSVDRASVRLFESPAAAQDFCTATHAPEGKHWTKCEILRDGDEIELCRDE